MQKCEGISLNKSGPIFLKHKDHPYKKHHGLVKLVIKKKKKGTFQLNKKNGGQSYFFMRMSIKKS